MKLIHSACVVTINCTTDGKKIGTDKDRVLKLAAGSKQHAYLLTHFDSKMRVTNVLSSEDVPAWKSAAIK